MYTEAKKLHLIEELLKVENDVLLDEVEALLAKSRPRAAIRKDFKNFVGALSAEEANELERNIAEGCEQINDDDWKWLLVG